MSTTPRQAVQPFYALGLPPTATRADLEREAQKLLGMLELGLRSAATYPTPLGPQPRSPELIRQSIADLRIPERRLLHELWAALPLPTAAPIAATTPGDPFREPPSDPPPPAGPSHPTNATTTDTTDTVTFPGAFELFAWRRP